MLMSLLPTVTFAEEGNGDIPHILTYNINTGVINQSAFDIISKLEGGTYIHNSELSLISWKDMYYTQDSSNRVSRVYVSEDGVKTMSNVLNLDKTDKFELQGRTTSDNNPRLGASGFISQFISRRFAADGTTVTAETYANDAVSKRPRNFVRIYIPVPGTYKLSVLNNFTPKTAYGEGASYYITKSGNEYTSNGWEAQTEVYFAKATIDIPYSSGTVNLTDAQIENLLTNATKLGWYDSGSYESKTELSEITASEAGEYYVIFNTCPESLEKNDGAWHRNLTTQYTDYQVFLLSGIELMPKTVKLWKVNVDIQKDIASVTGTMADGKSADLTEAEIKFSSSNSSIAFVDENTGKIESRAVGTVDILATVTLDGKTVTAKKKYTVTSAPLPASGVKAIVAMHNGENYTFAHGLNAKLVTYEDTKGTWKYHSQSNNSQKVSVNHVYGLQVSTGVGDWVAIEINVPTEGSYDVTLEHGVANSGGADAAGIWIFPEGTTDIGSKLTEDTAISTSIDFYEENIPTNPILSSTNLGKVSFPKAGKYIVVYKALKGGYRGTSGTMYPGKLILDGGSEIVLSGVLASVNKEFLNPGDTDVMLTELYMSDGKKGDNSKYTISYSSSDDTVASVSHEGVITANSCGNAVITATATNEKGYNYTASVSVPVAENGITIDYNISDKVVSDFNTLTYENSDGFWRYFDSSCENDRADENVKYENGSMHIGKDSWIAFEVHIPKADTYDLKINTEEFSDDVSVFVKKGETSFDTDDLVGRYNTASKTIENITFTETGDYVLTFKSSGNGVLGNISLANGLGETVLMSAKLEGIDIDKLSVRGVMSDGSAADLSSAKTRYASSDESVAEVNVITGAVRKLTIGETTLSATVTLNGITAVAKVCLKITEMPPQQLPCAEKMFDINFMMRSASWTPSKNPEQGFADSARDEDARGITYDYTDGNWAWFGVTPGYTLGINGALAYADRLRIDVPNGKWLALKIKVPKRGRYSATLEYQTLRTAGAVGDMYIIPMTDIADIDEKLTTENFIAQINYTDEVAADYSVTSKKLGMVQFEDSGEYLVVFKNISGRYITPRRLNLNGINALNEVYIDIEKTELNFGEEIQIGVTAERLDGSVLSGDQCRVMFESSDEDIVTATAGGVVKAVGDGIATITVTVSDGRATIEEKIVITAIDNTGVKSAYLDVPENLYVREKVKAAFVVVMNSGNEIKITDGIDFSYSKGGVAEIDSDCMIRGLSAGEVEISASGAFREIPISASKLVKVSLHEGKEDATYYTSEKRRNALENISIYSWAKDERKKAEQSAEKYVENFELLYDSIPGEGIPRSRQIGAPNDPDYAICRYCGENIVGKYGSAGVGGWNYNPITRPWKVQCPDCKRYFPSNDFGSFYKLGRNEHGIFEMERALDAHHNMLFHPNGEECRCERPEEDSVPFAERMPEWYHNRSEAWYEFYGYGNEKGYLYNELYTEISESNLDPLSKDKDGNYNKVVGSRWGVDDGFGYYPGRRYSETVEERHCYIALYHTFFWENMKKILDELSNAYLYTGDAKYGRAGAILVDRIADVLPDFSLLIYNTPSRVWMNTDGSNRYGAICGKIYDCNLIQSFTLATDAFYPMLEDTQVIKFLSEKAEKFELSNDKSSSMRIWENWEDRILLETFRMAKTGEINGNFGMAQSGVAIAAIVLDKYPETTEMLDWLFKTNTGANDNITGGNISSQLVDKMDRDSMGDEASTNYNYVWVTYLLPIAEILAEYEGNDSYNLYKNPKFAGMFAPFYKTILTGTHTAQIGDAGSTAGLEIKGVLDDYIKAFANLKETDYAKDIAKFIYLKNGSDVDGLHYDVFEKNPESLGNELSALVDEKEKNISEMMAGFGFAVLRDGNHYKSASIADSNNNQRDFWIYFGRNTGHGHYDTLNLGIEAFGLNLAPDHGYPENTGADPHRYQWVMNTLSHNTVTVGDNYYTSVSGIPHGRPLHFDDSGEVKLMDIDASDVYAATSNYRRTLVMVEVNDDISYGVDFFRVTGGDKHTFSFHSQAEHADAISGLGEVTAQVDENGKYIGSLAGADIPYGIDKTAPEKTPYMTKNTCGYTWLKNVRKYSNPTESYVVEFDVEDYNNAISDDKGIRLRMTQMNNFVADEVIIAGGSVPVTKKNAALPDTLDYVLAKREGENLDSLFTTVYEPYRGERYLSSIELCEVIGEVPAGATVKAVKVNYAEGKRTDYIVYATDNTKTYRIDNLFDFRGFVGVYSINSDGVVIYRYVNDGDMIGTETQKVSAYTGSIVDFSKEVSFDNNYIDVEMQIDDPQKIVGRYVFAETVGPENGAYKIQAAQDMGDGVIRLDIGNISPVRAHIDPANIDDGYLYTIKRGQTAKIPMPFAEDMSPEFADVNDLTTSAGSAVSVTVKAESPFALKITYNGTTLPRGAAIDQDTGVITWKPSSSQVGDNHFAIMAVDEDGRKSVIHFYITVYGSTTGGGSTGGGGGGETTTPAVPSIPNKEEVTTPIVPSKEDDDKTDRNVRFFDLDSHAWAADAINFLTNEGIIKGTSANTFSPTANITRADFAILLVRAFELQSDNEENFADVEESDYFAKELAIARNTGIVNGIGENKFAPRNTITRQDMMVIVYRAMQKLGVELEIADVSYNDFADVADYAQDAVKALITSGLLNGKSGKIAPTDYTTRAEVAVLIKRILDYTNK